MAIQVAINHTDTAVSGVSTLALNRAVLNFKSDFCIKQDDPGEAIISNRTSPIDCPEKFRFACSPVKDIYQNTDIEPSARAASRRGSRILCQLSDVYTLTDSSDATFRVNLPMEGHIVLTLPNDNNITEGMLLAFIGRLISGLFETGSQTASRLQSLLRGAMLPSDL